MLLLIAHRSLHQRVSAALATVVLTVALLAGPGQPAVAAAPSDALPAYSYHGDGCYFDHHPVLADAQAVRRSVPSRFHMLGEASGQVTLWVTLTSCTVSLNGTPLRPATFADVGVMIEPPTGLNPNSTGVDFYLLWELASLPQVAAINAAYGVDTEYVPDMVFRRSTTPLLMTVDTEVPWVESGAYRTAATHLGHTHPAVDGSLRWWSVGPQGLQVYDQFLFNESDFQGEGVIESTAGSRLAELIGTRAVVPAWLATTSISMTARVVGG